MSNLYDQKIHADVLVKKLPVQNIGVLNVSPHFSAQDQITFGNLELKSPPSRQDSLKFSLMGFFRFSNVICLETGCRFPNLSHPAKSENSLLKLETAPGILFCQIIQKLRSLFDCSRMNFVHQFRDLIIRTHRGHLEKLFQLLHGQLRPIPGLFSLWEEFFLLQGVFQHITRKLELKTE